MKQMAEAYGRHRDFDRQRRPDLSSSSAALLESGTLEIQDEVLPSSSPLVNVLGPNSDRSWTLLPATDLVPDIVNRIVKTSSGNEI